VTPFCLHLPFSRGKCGRARIMALNISMGLKANNELPRSKQRGITKN
jgi:hypothetical protein